MKYLLALGLCFSLSANATIIYDGLEDTVIPESHYQVLPGASINNIQSLLASGSIKGGSVGNVTAGDGQTVSVSDGVIGTLRTANAFGATFNVWGGSISDIFFSASGDNHALNVSGGTIDNIIIGSLGASTKIYKGMIGNIAGSALGGTSSSLHIHGGFIGALSGFANATITIYGGTIGDLSGLDESAIVVKVTEPSTLLLLLASLLGIRQRVSLVSRVEGSWRVPKPATKVASSYRRTVAGLHPGLFYDRQLARALVGPHCLITSSTTDITQRQSF